jgi:hypothetical protein
MLHVVEMIMSSSFFISHSLKYLLIETSLAKDFFHPNTLMHLPLKIPEREKENFSVCYRAKDSTAISLWKRRQLYVSRSSI